MIDPVHTQFPDGRQEWRLYNKLHRLDGPAVIEVNGAQKWYQNNKPHRLDGPAFIGADGTQEWCIDGKPHRLDGPAYIPADGPEEWWVAGVEITHLSAHEQLTHIRAYQARKVPVIS